MPALTRPITVMTVSIIANVPLRRHFPHKERWSMLDGEPIVRAVHCLTPWYGGRDNRSAWITAAYVSPTERARRSPTCAASRNKRCPDTCSEDDRLLHRAEVCAVAFFSRSAPRGTHPIVFFIRGRDSRRNLFRSSREREIKDSAARDVRGRPYASTVSFHN